MITVSLIVLNYNGRKFLKDYFTSVYRQTRMPDEILLFDNGSTDGSIEYVRTFFPKVRIIVEDRYNTGASRGLNIAFKETSGDYIVMQSNDIILDKNCIKVLAQTLDRNAQIGICTSVSMTFQKEKKIAKRTIENAGGRLDVFGFNWPLYYGKERKTIPTIGEVFLAYGTSMIVRREVFRGVNGFDEKYFALNDDVDLSWRVRLLGYKIVYNANSYIFHKIHATLGPLYSRAKKRYWSERNCLRTILKNYSVLSLIKYLPVYFLLLFAEIGWYLSHGRIDMAFSIIQAVSWNVIYSPDTLVKRFKIQKTRMVSDKQLIKIMYKKSFKWDHREWPKEW